MDPVLALFKTATTATDAVERQTAAVAIASAFAASSVSGSFAATNIGDRLTAAMAETGGPNRLGACQIVCALASGLKAPSEPFLSQLIEPLLVLAMGDEESDVVVGAKAALDAVIATMTPAFACLPSHAVDHLGSALPVVSCLRKSLSSETRTVKMVMAMSSRSDLLLDRL
jgi:hypothetical protein